MEYLVIWHEELIDVEKMVKDEMDDGWRPTGGISHDGFGYMQAMIR